MSFGRGDHVELAVALLADIERGGLPCVFDDGAIYRYSRDEGRWRIVEREDSSCIVQSFAGVRLQTAKVLKIGAKDVAGAISLAQDRCHRRDFFATAPTGLVFAGQFVRVTADGIGVVANAPEHRARYGYPFAYTEAPPRRWLDMLRALFRDDADQAERIELVQEFFGACLLGIATRYQRCLIAIGDGENGKSKFGDVMLAAMPDGSTCSVPPQSWGDEYRRAMLAGKRLNFVSELPEREIIESEPVKAVIDGSQIDARAIRQSPFNFRPSAGNFFAANALPGTQDQTHAFWRRMLLLRFTRSFDGDPAADPDVAATVVSTELPEVVGWLCAGARRLMLRGKYTVPASHAHELAEWKRGSDSVRMFVLEEMREIPAAQCFTAGPHWIIAADLYKLFRAWCDGGGYKAMARNKFGQRLRLVLPATHAPRSYGGVTRYPLLRLEQ